MSPRRQPTAAELGFGHLFSQLRDAIVVSDPEGRIVLWNPAAEKMFGYSSAEARGQDVAIIVPQRLRARHEAGMQRFRESGHGPLLDSGAILELPAVRKDGREITIEMRLSRIDVQGAYVMAMVRDVTDRVRLAAANEADRARLLDANDTLEAFSYVVGHDLKEPVRAVGAYLEALAEHVMSDAARGDLARAKEANDRLALLLGGLLEWSRATLGGLDRAPLRVDEVIRAPACSSRYERALEERGARLAFEGEFVPVLGTEPLLCQAFGNLLLNAIRHNPRPDATVTVLARDVEEGMLPIFVRDNGPGFPDDIKKRFAGRDERRPRRARGGFGLTIMTRAIETLGGRVALGDAPGGGGEARVWLPVAG